MSVALHIVFDDFGIKYHSRDDFGIKYQNRDDFDNLVQCLSTLYHVKAHPLTTSFVGLHVEHMVFPGQYTPKWSCLKH
jgi:hypothetical protein